MQLDCHILRRGTCITLDVQQHIHVLHFFSQPSDCMLCTLIMVFSTLISCHITRSFLCVHNAAYQAPVGTSINLEEASLSESCSATISLAAATRVFTITAVSFRQVLQDHPQLQQALFKDLSQQLTLSQANVQVTHTIAWSLLACQQAATQYTRATPQGNRANRSTCLWCCPHSLLPCIVCLLLQHGCVNPEYTQQEQQRLKWHAVQRF